MFEAGRCNLQSIYHDRGGITRAFCYIHGRPRRNSHIRGYRMFFFVLLLFFFLFIRLSLKRVATYRRRKAIEHENLHRSSHFAAFRLIYVKALFHWQKRKSHRLDDSKRLHERTIHLRIPWLFSPKLSSMSKKQKTEERKRKNTKTRRSTRHASLRLHTVPNRWPRMGGTQRRSSK